jgi:hypothetical protein
MFDEWRTYSAIYADTKMEITPEDEYKSLLRSLRRRKGFGLSFVRCSPVGGVELIQKVRDDLSQKQIGVLELKEPIDNLIDLVQSFPNQDKLNVLGDFYKRMYPIN